MKLYPSAVVLLCLALSGCTPKVPGPEPVPGPPLPSLPAPEASGSRTPPPAQPQAVRPVPARPFDESLLRGREFLLELSGPVKFSVRDPILGVLSHDAVLIAAAGDFFRDASDGRLEESRLVDRWSGYLRSWAQRFQKAGGGGLVRVGEPLVEDGGMHLVPVSVSPDSGPVLTGWLALVKDAGGYRISDVQLVESAGSTGSFDPESDQEISRPSLR